MSALNKSDLEKLLPAAKVDEFLLAIDQFNRGQYLECHDAFEEVWRVQEEPYRKLTQGIIQFAVALHHLGRGNRTGAAKLLKRSLHHLAPFENQPTGICVKRICQQINTILSLLETRVTLSADKIGGVQIELTALENADRDYPS